MRQSVRERYNIRGDTVDDALAACCCSPCELTQQSREIELEEASFVPEAEPAAEAQTTA
jgi:hypothetical protein